MSIQEGDEVPITELLTPEQIQNNAKGYVNRTLDETRFRRFLCLGSESGTYFVDQGKLTKENADCIIRYVCKYFYEDYILLTKWPIKGMH